MPLSIPSPPVGIVQVGAPNVPTAVTSIAKDGKCTVSWLAPSSGPTPTGYKITPYIGASAQSVTTVGNVTSADVTGLTNATAYTFTVKASNGVGDSAESAASGLNTPQANLLFGDEFNGSFIDPAWYVLNRDSDQSNSELAFYKSGQVTLDGSGNLKILCEHVDVTANTYSDGLYPSDNGSVTRHYRSGMVQTSLFKVPAPTGGLTTIVEFAGKMPSAVGSGAWCGSLWLLGVDCQTANKHNPDNVGGCNWPTSGEVDIAEFGIGGGGTLTSYSVGTFSSIGSAGGGSVSCTDANANSHVYRLEWTTSQLTWKLDGVSKNTYSGFSSQDMFIIINVTTVGSPNAGAFPSSMLIDYVHVFSQ